MLLINHLIQFYKYIIEDLSDPKTKDFPLMENPLFLIVIVSLYVTCVKYGPNLMQQFPPLKLNKIVLIYNISQIVFNTYLFILVFTTCYIKLRYNILCEPVSQSTSPEEMQIARFAHSYFLLKIYDLLDTVFIILRKKSSQLSFLHTYHHAGMVIVGWCGTKYVPGGQSMFLGTINTFVHGVMYSYYLLTIMNPKFQNVWWKKYITKLQIVQFVAIGLHLGIVLVIPGCKYPKFPVLAVLPNLVLLMKQFEIFYKATYKKLNKSK